MSRSRRQKKKFGGCGHRGYGKYCHYCKQQRDGYDFKKDRGKTDKEREEARIQAEQATGETDARLEAEAKWEWDEQQRAAEEERHRNEDYQPPPEDFEG